MVVVVGVLPLDPVDEIAVHELRTRTNDLIDDPPKRARLTGRGATRARAVASTVRSERRHRQPQRCTPFESRQAPAPDRHNTRRRPPMTTGSTIGVTMDCPDPDVAATF